MIDFVARHQDKILGTLTCFDRLIFRGHLPLGYSQAVEGFLCHKGILFKDLKAFLVEQADRLKEHTQSMAERASHPYRTSIKARRSSFHHRGQQQSRGVDHDRACAIARSGE